MQIVGNETIFKYLRLLAFEDKLSPSYLFVGPRGVGKYLAARWFAAAVLCEHKSEQGPCGSCTNCRRVESGVDAKFAVQDGCVKVNGQTETQRGKKLYEGDIFEYQGTQVKVTK